MWRFGTDWFFDDDGSPLVLADRDTGDEVRPVVVDEHTGKPIDVRAVRVRPATRLAETCPQQVLTKQASRAEALTLTGFRRPSPRLAAMVIAGSVAEVADALSAHDYLPDEGLATAIFLALRLHRPLLLEGEAGVGKTEVAKVLARWTGAELIRLQCYEGIDASQAVYEWDYSRQLLHLRAAEAAGTAQGAGADRLEDELYSERFLVKRPLLRAIAGGEGPPPVLLIDEVDRADDEFEAFLLEVLSDYQVTVPELRTFTAGPPDRRDHVQSHA
jgi:hypothetical protein